jgi:hypothetical protein
MADRAQFEQMLECLINEDKAKAEELFHDLVVAKSREIYENLLDDDMDIDEAIDDEDEEVEQSTEDDEEVTEEVSDDESNDMLDDLDGADEDEGDMDDEEGDEGDETGEDGDEAATKDDLDLAKQDIIDALTAEFEAMSSGEADAEEPEMDMGAEEGGEEEMAAEMFGDEELVMEYTQKVTANMGDNGANTKSTVAGKNDMGGSSANIAKGSGEEKGRPAPTAKVDNAGNVNVPGAKASKSMTSAKKATGGDNGANSKSTIGA